MHRFLYFLAAASLLLLPSCAKESRADPGPDAAASNPVFRDDGSLLRPRGYRSWMFVGTPLTPNDMNGGQAAFPEFHNVYIDPASYEAYERTGAWREGTVLIKELVSVGSKRATSGRGYFMGDYIGLEVSLKDSKRFPDEPGGWAFFRFTDEEGGPVHDTATILPTESCATCHQASAATQMVFTQYYPVLRAARGDGPADR